MDAFTRQFNDLLQLAIRFGELVLANIVSIKIWMRGQIAALGLPLAIQTTLSLSIAAMLILVALKLFGGLIRIAVVVVLLLIVIHVLLPVIER